MSKPLVYSSAHKALHWTIALFIAVLIPVGMYMVERGEQTRFDAITNILYTNHKTFGFVVFMLILIRLGLVVVRGTPAPVATLTPVQRAASATVHGLLYLTMLVMPLSGWAGVTAFPARGALFGLSIPPMPFVPVDQKLAAVFFEIHETAALVMIALLAAHVGAALFHRFIVKDGVFQRMTFGRKT